MGALSRLVDALRARSPLVPRWTRDELAAAHEDLTRRYEEIGGDDPVLRERLAMFEDPEVGPFLTFAPPGHFYSPIPRMSEALDHVRATQADPPVDLPGIDLRMHAQLALAEELARDGLDFDPPSDDVPDRRYFADNPAYGRGDGFVLQAMLRHFRPGRVVEVGSGYSSALMLDLVDGGLELDLTLIEPYDELVRSLLRPGDLDRLELVDTPVQQVPVERFASLEAGDLLFIDSTHVVKPGSDVAHEVFEILPRLAPGVLVHVHDVFHPFEYPVPWVAEGRVWSEASLLRAFLIHNQRFEVLLFPQYLKRLARDRLRTHWGRFADDGHGSLWLRVTG